LGFDPAVLARLNDETHRFDVSFVGSLAAVHQSRIDWLEKVCRACQALVWTDDGNRLPNDSPIRPRIRGKAWGLAMYRILRGSKITLNHHGSIPPFANNMRLYEATGVGTLLITDWKENLAEMFEPEREVVTYRGVEECVEKIRYYLSHDSERQSIAAAGQRRTLQDHTYSTRMQELVAIAGRYL
jgi:hypothetical protein